MTHEKNDNSEAHLGISAALRTRAVACAGLLLSALAACDVEEPEDRARTTSCDLVDPDCVAQPGAEQALVLLESMDVDLDVVDVELLLSGGDTTLPHEESALASTLATVPTVIHDSGEGLGLAAQPHVQQQIDGRCSFGGGWMCCCDYWGDDAGCGCGQMGW